MVISIAAAETVNRYIPDQNAYLDKRYGIGKTEHNWQKLAINLGATSNCIGLTFNFCNV